MALELYMLGLIVQDMSRSLAFYRQLGLAIPDGAEEQKHVEIKMGNGLTFFLDSAPSRWDPGFVKGSTPESPEASNSYPSILEFFLKTRTAVEEKYAELTGLGYQGYRTPYTTSFGMCFALVKDPDGNTILLSGELAESASSKEG